MENIKAKATNYVPESIGFSEGYLYGLMKPDLGYIMIADWDKAKAIIEKLIADGRNVVEVEMGLDGDWRENSMTVWEDGQFMEYSCLRALNGQSQLLLCITKTHPRRCIQLGEKRNIDTMNK